MTLPQTTVLSELLSMESLLETAHLVMMVTTGMLGSTLHLQTLQLVSLVPRCVPCVLGTLLFLQEFVTTVRMDSSITQSQKIASVSATSLTYTMFKLFCQGQDK